MRFLITGGAGFIGSHLSERLILQGHRVTVLDDLSTGSLDNVAALAGHPRFEFVQGSVLSKSLVRRLVAASDRVIHLAAAVGVRRILQDPLSSLKINIDGCDNVLSACAESGRGVLVASTSEVYGKNDAESLCENADSILGPASIERWSYATAKKLDEFLALAYHASYGGAMGSRAARWVAVGGRETSPRNRSNWSRRMDRNRCAVARHGQNRRDWIRGSNAEHPGAGGDGAAHGT